MTLYSEVEALLDYLKEDDWFYYLLVYDPQQKTLLADCGEISVGDEYQTEVEKNMSKGIVYFLSILNHLFIIIILSLTSNSLPNNFFSLCLHKLLFICRLFAKQ